MTICDIQICDFLYFSCHFGNQLFEKQKKTRQNRRFRTGFTMISLICLIIADLSVLCKIRGRSAAPHLIYQINYSRYYAPERHIYVGIGRRRVVTGLGAASGVYQHNAVIGYFAAAVGMTEKRYLTVVFLRKAHELVRSVVDVLMMPVRGKYLHGLVVRTRNGLDDTVGGDLLVPVTVSPYLQQLDLRVFLHYDAYIVLAVAEVDEQIGRVYISFNYFHNGAAGTVGIRHNYYSHTIYLISDARRICRCISPRIFACGKKLFHLGVVVQSEIEQLVRLPA